MHFVLTTILLETQRLTQNAFALWLFFTAEASVLLFQSAGLKNFADTSAQGEHTSQGTRPHTQRAEIDQRRADNKGQTYGNIVETEYLYISS
jgi:hypothetical protein